MRIKNWSKFQHFKDRKPPWIKLHREILDQRDINAISDGSFRILIGLWLLASEDEEKDGNLPGIDDIAFRLRTEKPKIIKALQELESFIVCDDIDTISEGYQDDLPEEEAYKQEGEKKNISASEGEVYLTKKKRKLKGEQLSMFNSFWTTFAYQKGKAEAADAWLDLKVTSEMYTDIIAGASSEAAGRQALIADNRTPKMAQGWLSGRRWEDGANGVVSAAPWHTTAPGIRAKGLEYGIKEEDYEIFPEFKAAVFEATRQSSS
jgi:hypothetical protein